MIYFVLDGSGIEVFAQGLQRAGSTLAERIRLIEYSQLSKLAELPLGTYVFLDLLHSPPARRKLAQIAAGQLAGAGAKVLNDPGKVTRPVFRWSPMDDPNGIRYPAVLRSRHQQLVTESLPLDSPEELYEAGALALMEGFHPDSVHALEVPSPDSDGRYSLRRTLRIGETLLEVASHQGREWPPHQPNPDAGPAHDVRLVFDRFGIEAGLLEYTYSNGNPEVWAIEDSAVALWSWGANLQESLLSIDSEGSGAIRFRPDSDQIKAAMGLA